MQVMLTGWSSVDPREQRIGIRGIVSGNIFVPDLGGLGK